MELDGSPDQTSLVRWDISSIPSTSFITEASITFNIVNTSIDDFEIYEALHFWDEGSATFETAVTGVPWGAPGATGITDHKSTVLAKIFAAATGPLTVNLNASGIAAVQRWASDPSRNHGFILQDIDDKSRDRLDMSSSEATGLGPKLDVKYTLDTVTHPNNAPVLDDSGSPVLTTIPEHVSNNHNPGDTVASVFGSFISDPDFDALAGVAVVGVTGLENGNWQYSTNNGTSWFSLIGVSDSSARLLPDTARIRFVPVGEFSGTVSISVRAWDQTDGIDVADLTGETAIGDFGVQP